MASRKLHVLLFCLVLCFFNEAIAGTKTPRTTDVDITMVRASSFEKCPNVTVDDMANGFLGSPSWSVARKKGFKYVNLRGQVIFKQKKVRVLLPFKITEPNNWSLDDLEMNDVVQSPLLRSGLIERMCESAQPAAEAPAAEAPAAEAPAPEADADAPAPAAGAPEADADSPAPAAEAPSADAYPPAPAADAPSKRKPRRLKGNKP